MDNDEVILILDFGSQYTQLIARRIRELKTFCRIVPCTIPAAEIKKIAPKGLVLSGGPASVYIENAPKCEPDIFKLGIPTLGICYGLQIFCQQFGAEVQPAQGREYGETKLQVVKTNTLFKGTSKNQTVWMSHGDQVSLKGAKNFEVLATTRYTPAAAVMHKKYPFFGLQFHPEVYHTPEGVQILANFVNKICGCTGQWEIKSVIKKSVSEIKAQVGEKGRVILGLSGGVDSSVAAMLINKAIGDRLTCIFVDHGMLRKNESEEVEKMFKGYFKMNLIVVDAAKEFFKRLQNVVDPEVKRTIIGHTFIKVFEREARKLKGVKFLGQGTLYPDVIESVSPWGGPSATIKKHHNVGGLPDKLDLKLVEPLRDFFKDEVRQIGVELGLADEILWRHPFPGPGLAVRILGDVTIERVRILQAADSIIIEEIKKAGLYREIWQAFGVLLPIRTVGVMGDERTYEHVIAVRAVDSVDGMTANWSKMPHKALGEIANRIVSEVKGVNRVVYDITSKPPATIEWE